MAIEDVHVSRPHGKLFTPMTPSSAAMPGPGGQLPPRRGSFNALIVQEEEHAASTAERPTAIGQQAS